MPSSVSILYFRPLHSVIDLLRAFAGVPRTSRVNRVAILIPLSFGRSMNFGASQTAFLSLFVFGLARSIGVNRLGVMLSRGKGRRLGVSTYANSILFLAMFATVGPIV